MSKALLIWAAASVVIAVFSGVLVYVRGEQMANPKELAAREMIAMHVVYAAGFGWLVPLLLKA